jgi:putative Holliday junction resolvase
LGIDWGSRRIGVAVSDESREFIWPRPQILNKDWSVANINGENVVGIVIGLPLHADGTDSETTSAVRAFADALSKQTDLPIAFIEENLTSVEASARVKTNIDSESAAIILENAIAMIKRVGSNV